MQILPVLSPIFLQRNVQHVILPAIFFAYKYCKLRLILEDAFQLVLFIWCRCFSTFKLFLIILTYTPCISMMMNLLLTVYFVFCVPIVNWTLFIFLSGCHQVKCSATVTWGKKQRTSCRCFSTGFLFKSKVDLQDRVYLDYVPWDKIVKFVFVISQRKTQESKEDIIIVKLSSIYQTGSYLGSFRGSRELYCKFVALKLGRI